MAHHRAEIAAHAAAIVRKDAADALHIGGARIVGDEKLDELLADEHTAVRMLEKMMNGIPHIALRILQRRRTCRDDEAAERARPRAEVMTVGVQAHRRGVVLLVDPPPPQLRC